MLQQLITAVLLLDCRYLRQRFRLAALVTIAWTMSLSPVYAQLTWEYSPYDIRVWIALDDHPALSTDLQDQIADSIRSACRGSAGYAWKIDATEPPDAVAFDVLHRSESLTPQRLGQLNREYLRGDKLITLAVQEHDGEYRVVARELDLATRLWGDPLEMNTRQREAIPSIAAYAVVDVVRPLAKIDKVQGRTVRARLRAGGLIEEPESPALVNPGQAMQPVVRRNARNGEPLPQGIYAPPWSYLQTENRTDSTVHFALHSGFGSVIPTKGGPRTERLALAFHTRHEQTRLQLRARPAVVSRGAPITVGRPLAGYEIFVKNPGEENTEFVGLTDAQGQIELFAGDKPLRLFYIRNGGQLLGRLPLVVGHHAEATATVIDDDARLLAESYVKALQSRVMDLVARREILSVRVQAKLKKGDYDAAKQLVDEFRALPSRAQLLRDLEEMQRRIGNVPGTSGKRIDKLFIDGQRLLAKFLDPNTVDRLATEVAEAERQAAGGGSQPASSEDAPSTAPPATTT